MSVLTIVIPGIPVSGNHRTGRTPEGGTYVVAEAREYARRIRSIAIAAAVEIGWQMPDYVRVDLELVNCRLDRDNASKTINDALQGIAYANDSRILDGNISRYKDGGEPSVTVHVEAVNGIAYGFKRPRRLRACVRVSSTRVLPPHVRAAVERARALQ